ncbi:MAG TPA: hypothetical protein PK307_18415 [Spirochaetota bacterium]|jgi:hypothetical protein|nr:hypothetical protein [Spirochaetota bacterium]HOR92835.1 hypothetical protein [Spirochaetota bacterium]HOT18584.1 hypothetical protein [Spirochaetota bacterium]HPD03825.1 hypothetical protein [Spirochaetota bacterium]HQG42358.1 hypothetical protein [Spirochaetota bacterium]
MNDLEIREAWIIAPVKETYMLTKTVRVAALYEFVSALAEGSSKS